MRFNSSNPNADRTSTTDRTGNGTRRLFAAAVVLARRGRYADAAKLLQKALDAGACSEAEALDLQARICAQQGLHLHAESCWHRAKHLDGSNPAYDEALSHLRRVRFSPGRLLQLIAALSATAILSLLLWQVVFVNPTVVNRQDATEMALAAIRGEIVRSQDALLGRDQGFATSITGLGSTLRDFDLRLSERLKTLPTTTGTARDRDAVIVRLDEQVATLQKAFEREVASLGTHRAEADAAQVQRIVAIEAAIADIGKMVTSLEGELAKRVEAGYAGFTKRVDAMETSIQRDMKSLPTSAKLAAVVGDETAARITDTKRLTELLRAVQAGLTELEKHSDERSKDQQESHDALKVRFRCLEQLAEGLCLELGLDHADVVRPALIRIREVQRQDNMPAGTER